MYNIRRCSAGILNAVKDQPIVEGHAIKVFQLDLGLAWRQDHHAKGARWAARNVTRPVERPRRDAVAALTKAKRAGVRLVSCPI